VIDLELQGNPKPWSTNEDRNKNPYERAQIVALWKQSAFIAYRNWKVRARQDGHLEGKQIVTVEIAFPMNRERDPHNYCGTVVKAIIDGLKEAGAFPNDTFEYVGHREPRLVVGKDARPTVRIEREATDGA